MMIKINLLPVRQVKKREISQQILVLYAVLLVAALGGNWYWYNGLEKTARRNQQEIATVTQSIKELEKVIGEVNNIKEREKELKDKLAVLEELRKGRNGPVRILDALATATPAKVWFTNFDEKGGQVRLTGTATSHEDVADLMRQLKSVVWTSKGMARLVEVKKEATRVELIGSGGEMAEFSNSEVGAFFEGVELITATQKSAGAELGARKLVEFTLNFTARYTL